MRPGRHGLDIESSRQRKRRERQERKTGDRDRLKQNQRPFKRRDKTKDEGRDND